MTGEITRHARVRRSSYQLDDAGRAAIAAVRDRATDTVDGEIGFDLLQWGDIDDVHGRQQHNRRRHAVGADRQGHAARSRTATSSCACPPPPSTARRRGRLRGPATPLHRWFDAKFEPVDGEPTYSLHLRTRGTGVTAATLRLATYDVDDSDPTTEPVSTLLHQTTVPLAVPDSSGWTDVDVDVSSLVDHDVGKLRPNAVLLYINLPRGSKALDVDDVRLTEWRDVSAIPGGVWIAADSLRGEPGATMTVEQSGCTAPPS